ncbi:MAG: 2-amino-4-hydroxy-6-hydroxymethyldihydropteridine diphosphokinase [Anaerolineae bacterium]
MGEQHQAYLSLGSNIRPAFYLPRAIEMLKQYGQVTAVSSVWETLPVGSDGPNFLNACVCFVGKYSTPVELKEKVIRPIEATLGRVRGANKYAPRTIDLDIVLFDSEPINIPFWEYAFIVVPLAELLPETAHPTRTSTLREVAQQMQIETWMQKRHWPNLS